MSRSISTTPRTRRTSAWRLPGQKRPICTALASTWTSSAEATTDISRPSPGPPDRARRFSLAPIRVPSADSFGLRQDLPAFVSATIVTALAGVTVIAWIYTWLQVRAMTGIEDMAMPTEFGPWTISDVALNVAIWWIMMIGMMLPSGAPMMLVFAAANRSRRGGAFVPTAVFAAG